MRRFTWRIAALASVFAMTLAACGGNPKPNPKPTPTGQAAGSCASPDANAGRRVIYAGPQDIRFPNANATYVGEIVAGSIGEFIHVSFPHLASPTYLRDTELLLEAICTPSVVNLPVIYNGPELPGKFPAPAAPPAYTGTITRAYISWATPHVGWFEVAWGAPLNRTIAVKFSDVYY